MPLQPGTILENRYRVDSLLGQGGMGAVYHAWDERLRVSVALKENNLATPDAREQFQREAQVLARLHHTNLPKVIDHFITADGSQYLVMSFIEGLNLAELMAARGRQSPADVMSWLGQVCDALTYLHNQNPPVIHRDIKPQNIKITPDGRVFLVDFGLSKVGSTYQSTASGALGVTPGYSPLEQYGSAHTDQRSDIYALAATLYTMLTGETPPESVKRAVGTAALVPPRAKNPALSPALERALAHGLETQPTNRPATVAVMRREVEAALASSKSIAPQPHYQPTPVNASVPPRSTPPRVPARERRFGAQWLFPMLLVGVMALAFLVWQLNRGISTGPAAGQLTATEPGSPSSQNVTRVVLSGATAAGPKEIGTKTPAALPTDVSTPTSTAAPSPTPTVPTATPKPTNTPTPTNTPGPSVCSLPAASEFRTLWQMQWRFLGCPLNQASSSLGAAERFEHGRMIWCEHNDMIYVLYDNGSWADHQDIYVEGAAEPGGYQPPDGRQVPVRGFGAIWREKLGGADARIGWAIEQERGLDMLSQAFEKGMILQIEGQTYVLGDRGGRWLAP